MMTQADVLAESMKNGQSVSTDAASYVSDSSKGQSATIGVGQLPNVAYTNNGTEFHLTSINQQENQLTNEVNDVKPLKYFAADRLIIKIQTRFNL